MWAYLLLVPRFINGQLVVQGPRGGEIPYRGGDLIMHVDGRVLKYKVNEDGYWSIPIVSQLPHKINLQVYNVDAGSWFPVEFKWTSAWVSRSFKLIINPSGVEIASNIPGNALSSKILTALGQLITFETHDALAGGLQLPHELQNSLTTPEARVEKEQITRDVIKAINEVTNRNMADITPIFPLNGVGAPKYVERIVIIQILERKFRFSIPDEHWNYLNTVEELADYIQKKILLNRRQQPDVEKTPNMPGNMQNQNIGFQR